MMIGGMSRRPGESAAAWFERAITTHSAAAAQHETFVAERGGNPAASAAIAQRLEDAAADLQQAEAAYRAERQRDRTADLPAENRSA